MVPAQFRVLVIRRPRYACRACEDAFVQAPAPAIEYARHIPVTVYGINEPTPGWRWKALFDATWPAYRAWYLSQGEAARPDLVTATAQLERHMPELMPTYRRLVALADDDDVAGGGVGHGSSLSVLGRGAGSGEWVVT